MWNKISERILCENEWKKLIFSCSLLMVQFVKAFQTFVTSSKWIQLVFFKEKKNTVYKCENAKGARTHTELNENQINSNHHIIEQTNKFNMNISSTTNDKSIYCQDLVCLLRQLGFVFFFNKDRTSRRQTIRSTQYISFRISLKFNSRRLEQIAKFLLRRR